MTTSELHAPVTEVLPDSRSLREARRARVVEAMAAAGVDVLVIGSEPNARYISGVPRLWINGTHPFGPGCIFARDNQELHLVSTWDEGVPEEIPREHLHGITFNGMNSLKMMQGVTGSQDFEAVGTDGLMPNTARSLKRAFPKADLVDAEHLLQQVRSVKLPEEVEAIRRAVAIAEQALADAEAAVRPGTTERQITGVFMESMADLGVTTPTTQDVAWIGSRDRPWQRASRDAAVREGDLVVLSGGVIAGGYVGELARTVRAGGGQVDPGLLGRWADLWDRLTAACRPGASGADLLDAYGAAGLDLPPVPIARGLGLGNDLPLVTAHLPRSAADQRIEVGQVLVLTAYVWQQGVGEICVQEPVHVTDSGLELLSSRPFRDVKETR